MLDGINRVFASSDKQLVIFLLFLSCCRASAGIAVLCLGHTARTGRAAVRRGRIGALSARIEDKYTIEYGMQIYNASYHISDGEFFYCVDLKAVSVPPPQVFEQVVHAPQVVHTPLTT